MTTMKMRSVCALMLASGVVAGVVATGGVALGSSGQAGYSQNKKGETFGSALNADTASSEPDLIEAIATNGALGYVRKSDLDGERARTPAEAVAASNAAVARSIKVFAADGVTVVGTFIVGTGKR